MVGMYSSLPTDLRFTSYVINNLLYLTPDRHLLYVTDAVVVKHTAYPSHLFEHLACFFPGLLALGVHLLPLDRLDTLGIDVASLSKDLFASDRQDHVDLSRFNLADLHLWAAEGIAQTCYLTYADQPTGLGPEMMRMFVDPQEGEIRWMDAMHSWKEGDEGLFGWWRRAGRWGEHLPPGVRDIKPWVSSLAENATIEAMMVRPSRGKSKVIDTFGRDYLIKIPTYLLRPEVRGLLVLWGACLSAWLVADGRIALYPMAHDRRREMAPSRLGHLSGYRTLHQDGLWVHQRRRRPHGASDPDGFNAEVSRTCSPCHLFVNACV